MVVARWRTSVAPLVVAVIAAACTGTILQSRTDAGGPDAGAGLDAALAADAGRVDAGQANDAGLCTAFDAGPLDPNLVAQGMSLVLQYDCQQCHGTLLQGNSNGVQVPCSTTTQYPPNLTPDLATGLGCWSNAQIINAILNGVDNQGNALCGPMPQFSYLGVTQQQASAIVAYLRSLQPVANNAPSGPSCACQSPTGCPFGESCVGGNCICESLACALGTTCSAPDAGAADGGAGDAGVAALDSGNAMDAATVDSGSPVDASIGKCGIPPDAGLLDAGANSVLQRGNDLFRRDTFVEPALTACTATTMQPNTAFNGSAKFNGSVQTSVLYLENGPAMAGCPAGANGCNATTRVAGNGLFFASAATDEYALDETSGLTVWHTNFAVTGDGIRGTPVIDPVSRTLYVAVGASGQHQIHALSVDNGSERSGWPVILSTTTLTASGVPFNSSNQNQHGALLLANNILYIPFGGHYGDGGTYRGWIVAINTSNPTQVSGWVTLGSNKMGIWGHGGLASDGTNVFAETGNGVDGTHWDSSDSEEVVRIVGMAQFTRNAANVYYPTIWHNMDGADLDFGSCTPAYVPLPPGSTPPALLVAPAKPGHVYFLDATNLSGGSYPDAGGEVADLVVASTTAESVYTSPTIYQSASGLHAAINVGVGAANCPNGVQGNKMIISMLIQPGATPIAQEVWCAPVNGDTSGDGHHNAPPISTTTDANGSNALVWFLNGTTAGAQLTAVNGDTGALVYTTTGAACPNIPNMSFPIAVKGRIVVAASGALCSWSPGGTF